MGLKHFVVLLGLTLLSSTNQAAYQTLSMSVQVGSESQRVFITKPDGNGPMPALLFIGGMGCYTLDFTKPGPKAAAYEQIIDEVTRLGYVTMRVEKTGMGDNQGTTPCEEQDFRREVAGNLTGLQALSAYPFVNPKELYIFGHSIGGVIAPLIASEVPVKGIAVFGTLAEKWFDYEVSNIRRQFLLSGMSPQEVNQYMPAQIQAREEFYLRKKSPAQIAAERPHLANALQFNVHWKYMQQLAKVNPVIDWNRTTADVLILSGDSDYIGSQASELSKMIMEANRTRGNPIKMIQIPYIDHFFRLSFSQPESFKNANDNGFPLLFQSDILKILKSDFLKLPNEDI